MIIELILLIFLLIFFLLYSKYNSKRKLLADFQGPPGLPLIGNAIDFTKGNIFERILPHLSDMIKKYGPRTKFYIGWIPNLLIASAEDVEKILGSSVHIQKGDLYNVSSELLGQGLVTVTGEKWHYRRKLLTPSFHYKILEDFVPVIEEQALQFVSILKSKQGKNPITIDNEIMLAALDVVCETALGRKVFAQINSDSPYVRAEIGIAKQIMARIFTPWLIPDFLWKLSTPGKIVSQNIKTIHGFTNNVIKEKIEERKRKRPSTSVPAVEMEIGIKTRVAFLDLLLQIQEDKPDSISNKDMVDDVETFLFAGHDTSATALKWAILILGNHPEVQSRVHEELDEIFGDDRNRPVTMADIRRMEYLELVIKETLRMFPPAPAVMRQITTPLTFGDGAVVKPGVTAWIPILHLHHNPKYWDCPERFEPERFTAGNSRGRHPFAYIPFSAGPRNCIGQKFAMLVEKIMLATLLREFRIQSMKKMDEIKPSWELIYLPLDGVQVKLSSRHKETH